VPLACFWCPFICNNGAERTVVGGAARSRGRWIFGMHGRCLTLHGGRHACEYACVHTTKVLLVLHACMCYLYVCMCGCTTDTCLLVFCMLVVHARCLCALLICVVNGKSGCCLSGCFVLLYLLRIYECVVAMHGEER
jgi:hypothetical protein